MANCDGKYTVLIIDGEKLRTAGIYNDWINDKENTDLFCDMMVWDRKAHTHDPIVVSLEKFWDMDEQIYWLRKNQQYICYEESYPFIEAVRKVDLADQMIPYLRVANEYPIPFSDIVSDSGIQLSDLFANFLTISMDGTSRPVFGSSPHFSANPTCLSMPFLSSLFQNHSNVIRDPLECEFLFKCVDVTYYGKRRRIVSFRLRYDGVMVGSEYYDYSTQPGTMFLYNHFV